MRNKSKDSGRTEGENLASESVPGSERKAQQSLKPSCRQTPARPGSGLRGLWVSEAVRRVLERSQRKASMQVFSIIGC